MFQSGQCHKWSDSRITVSSIAIYTTVPQPKWKKKKIKSKNELQARSHCTTTVGFIIEDKANTTTIKLCLLQISKTIHGQKCILSLTVSLTRNNWNCLVKCQRIRTKAISFMCDLYLENLHCVARLNRVCENDGNL